MAKKTELETRVEEFRDKISAIQKSIRQIKRTGINENVLYLIIQRSSQRFLNTRYTKPFINISDVKAVIAGVEDLSNYMFAEEVEKNEGDAK